jgi:hypothetical protein
MSRSTGSRTLALTAPLTLALLLGACGGAPTTTSTPTTAPTTAATTAPVPTTTATAAPTETAAATDTASPTETAAPTQTATATSTPSETGSPAASPSGPAGDPAAALAALDSYRFTLLISGVPMGNLPPETVARIGGTVVHKPQNAARIDLAGVPVPLPNATGTAPMDATITIIGEQAWITASGTTVPMPAAALAGVAVLLPETFAGNMLRGTVGRTQAVGTEQKNGVTATHFQLTETALAEMRQGLGSTDARFDLWIAEDGYLVALEMDGTRTDQAGAQTPFDIDVQITNPNDPTNVVQAPA